MADYSVKVTLHDTTPPTLTFEDASDPHGDLNIEGHTEVIEFSVDPGSLPFTFVAIKIAPTQADLGSAPAVSSGAYQGTPFDCITIPANGSSLTLTDHVDGQTWSYCLGVRFDGTEYWPDPKIYNDTGGPDDQPRQGFTIQNRRRG